MDQDQIIIQMAQDMAAIYDALGLDAENDSGGAGPCVEVIEKMRSALERAKAFIEGDKLTDPVLIASVVMNIEDALNPVLD